jgi:cytoskeletal protein RodZ
MKVQINSSVIDGSPSTNRKAIIKAFNEFNGKEVTITIEKKKKRRSVPQNSYYWGCVLPILKAAIYDSWGEVKSIDEIHNWAKMQFNYTEKINETTGEVVKLPKSTTQNTTTDQETYHEEIRRFAHEWFNVEIPLPNTQLTIK